MKQQQGFTLIELIVVIVITGILAAVAVPKFASLQIDARVAKLKAASSSVQAAAASIRSAVMVRGGTPDTANCTDGTTPADNVATVSGTVCTEAGAVNLTYGYPASSALGDAGIISAAGLSSTAFKPTLADLNLAGYGVSVTGGVTTISVLGGTGTTGGTGVQENSTCKFTYTTPTGNNRSPTISANTITGC